MGHASHAECDMVRISVCAKFTICKPRQELYKYTSWNTAEIKNEIRTATSCNGESKKIC